MRSLSLFILDFDSISNPLLGAGQAHATFEVGRRLVSRGHRVTVISAAFPGCCDEIRDGISYRYIGIATPNIKLNTIFYLFSLPFSVRRIRADIILECFTAPISTLCTPLFTRIPVVALPTMFNAQFFSKKYHLPFHLVERWGCRLYSYFLPYTQADDGRMKQFNPGILSRIVPEGVSDAYFSIQKKKPRYILSLGRFDIKQKGLDLLLSSFASVSSKLPYPLLLVGKGCDEKKLREMADQYVLGAKIQFRGPAYGEDKLALLSEAAFVAFPSRHEGFSLFMLEAMAAGLPIVGFDIPGLSWASTDGVLKARPFDTNEFSRLLLSASDPQTLPRLSQAARDYARPYTWDHVADSFASFFSTVVRSSRAGKTGRGRV